MLPAHHHHYAICPNLETVTAREAVSSLQTTSLLHHDQFNAMLLTIPGGHVLREHLSPRALTLQIVAGCGRITVGHEAHAVARGAWLWIAPNTPHEIASDDTLSVLLCLFPLSKSESQVSTDD